MIEKKERETTERREHTKSGCEKRNVSVQSWDKGLAGQGKGPLTVKDGEGGRNNLRKGDQREKQIEPEKREQVRKQEETKREGTTEQETGRRK